MVQLQVRPKSIHFIVETSVSVIVGNSRITSKVSFLLSDDEDTDYLVELHYSPTHLLERTILFKSIPFFCGKPICLGIVREEYPITWDNLQSSTCLIWNRFVTFYTRRIFQMFKKRYNMVGRTIPWCHFNRPDEALFSVKAAVSKASLFKRDIGKLIYVIFDLTMS